MSDALFWLFMVAAILAVQASEPPTPAAQRQLAGGGKADVPLLGPGAAGVARAGMVVAAAIMVLLGLLTMAGASSPTSSGGSDRNHALVGGALQLAAGLICLGLFYFGTERVPGLRLLRSRSPISWLALVLLFESLAINLTPSAGQATVNNTIQPSAGPSAESLMLGEIPFLLLGLAAAGPLVRRTLVEAAERLGLWPLRLPWWVVGLAAGLVLVPVGDWVAGWLSGLTSVQCVQQQVQVQHAITGTARTALEQVGVAIAAGVGEETLFRGALQPRIGILLSSALWASYHLDYTCNGLPSSSNLYILLLGFAFGGLRKVGGLWPAIIAHTVYDGVILLGLF